MIVVKDSDVTIDVIVEKFAFEIEKKVPRGASPVAMKSFSFS